MDTTLFLLVEGITSGAVYGLVALSLIIVYSVTRVVNIAQGEYVALGALSFASSLAGALSVLSLLVIAGIGAYTVIDLVNNSANKRERLQRLGVQCVWVVSILLVNYASWASGGSYWLSALAALVTVSSLGSIVYRMTVEPISNASPVVLVIVSVGAFMVLNGLAVIIWGAQPLSVAPIADGGAEVFGIFVSYQSFWICTLSLTAMATLYIFSQKTLLGQALQAVAINATGAQLCGIPTKSAGQLSFALSAAFSCLSGLLLAPLVTANYDMGLPIGLKAFVAAALGGIMEYPTALVGVALVGSIESFAAYQVSAFRDVIVFLLIIPILLWRNAVSPPQEHEG